MGEAYKKCGGGECIKQEEEKYRKKERKEKRGRDSIDTERWKRSGEEKYA